VTLDDWAARLLGAEAPPEIVALHVYDTIAAFLAGLDIADGRALRRFYTQGEFAAAAAAIARLSECDDIHLASCVTPGAAVIPVALAYAETSDAQTVHRAIAAGYAAGISLGTAIGGTRALHNGVWPSLLAAPLMSAVTASCLLGYDAPTLAHAMALSLAGASGRIGRPSGSPSGRWFAFAECVQKGIRAAQAAGQGFRGDLSLITPAWLAAQGGHHGVDASVFETTPSIAEVGFKPFPIARQGLNAVIAFQQLLGKGVDPHTIEAIEVSVPATNAALLSRPATEHDRLSRMSSIGYQLACAALTPSVLYDPERMPPPGVPLMEFAQRVTVIPAQDFDVHMPNRWPARVVVNDAGERFAQTVIQSPLDADAPFVKEALTKKWRRIALAKHAETFFPDRRREEFPSYAILWTELKGRLGG